MCSAARARLRSRKYDDRNLTLHRNKAPTRGEGQVKVILTGGLQADATLYLFPGSLLETEHTRVGCAHRPD